MNGFPEIGLAHGREIEISKKMDEFSINRPEIKDFCGELTVL